MTRCFPLLLYSKELGMQLHEGALNFFLGVFPFKEGESAVQHLQRNRKKKRNGLGNTRQT